MEKIPLTQGKYAIVDDDQFVSLSQFRWFAQKHGRTYYPLRWKYLDGGKRKIIIRMHRLIMNAPDGIEVDHKDGNGLNCQKENMRFCNHQGNSQNRRVNINSQSGFKGVSWHKYKNKWMARIGHDGQIENLGNFTDKEDAALAYNAAALKYFGEFAKLNEMR